MKLPLAFSPCNFLTFSLFVKSLRSKAASLLLLPLTQGCCTAASGNELQFHRIVSRSQIYSRCPRRHPASADLGSSTCSDLCSTTKQDDRDERENVRQSRIRIHVHSSEGNQQIATPCNISEAESLKCYKI